MTDITKQLFPHLPVLEKPAGDMYPAMRSEECLGSAVPKFQWQLDNADKNTNGDCKYDQVGSSFTTHTASWTMETASTDCTSLVRDVIDVLLYEMDQEGYIQQQFDHLQASQRTVTCAGLLGNPKKKDGHPLQVEDLGGIFFLIICAAVGCCVVRELSKRGQKIRRESFAQRCDPSAVSDHPVLMVVPRSQAPSGRDLAIGRTLTVTTNCTSPQHSERFKSVLKNKSLHDQEMAADATKICIRQEDEIMRSGSLMNASETALDAPMELLQYIEKLQESTKAFVLESEQRILSAMPR